VIVLRFASGNLHKLEEVRQILGDDFRVLGLTNERVWPEVEESGQTFRENAALKARAISVLVPEWTLADDSGLEVDLLGGEPGVQSARYAGVHGDTSANNALLLARLSQVVDQPIRARFRCALALAKGGKVYEWFEGTIEGAITLEPRGEGGFGYDPLFVPDGYEETLAELGAVVKNELSHRARALAQLRSWFNQKTVALSDS
jgi:XTP/dITP diphosphohydrolase